MYRIGKADALDMLKQQSGYKIRRTNDYKYQLIIDSRCGSHNTIIGWLAGDLFNWLLDNHIIENYSYSSDGEYYILAN